MTFKNTSFQKPINFKALFQILVFAILSLCTQIRALELLGESIVGLNPMGPLTNYGSPNGKSHQLDILVTYKGWQYSAFYNNEQPRRIVLARRNHLSPTSTWESFVYRNYAQTTNDGHNVISMGVSSEDGTLHLAFDHHVSNLHYLRSVIGLLNNPEKTVWNANQFGEVTDYLGTTQVKGVTYPLFVSSPKGKLFFSRRLGNPNDGDQILYEYSGSKWTTIGKYIEGAGANPYMDGLVIGRDGRMHASWIWRQGSPESAHDICYAYSDDDGRNWHTTDGKKSGSTDEGALSRLTAPQLTAVPIAKGLMINQEGLTVDLKNRPHIVHKVGNTYHHFYREADGKWNDFNTGLSVSSRPKIATDALMNAYILIDGFSIAMATESSNYRDWKIVYEEKNKFTGTPLVDRFILDEKNILSIYLISAGYKSIVVKDFKLPGTILAIRTKTNNVKNNYLDLSNLDLYPDALGRKFPLLQSSLHSQPVLIFYDKSEKVQK